MSYAIGALNLPATNLAARGVKIPGRLTQVAPRLQDALLPQATAGSEGEDDAVPHYGTIALAVAAVGALGWFMLRRR